MLRPSAEARNSTAVARPSASRSRTSASLTSLAHSGYRGKSVATAKQCSGEAAMVIVWVADSAMARILLHLAADGGIFGSRRAPRRPRPGARLGGTAQDARGGKRP